MGWDEHSMTPQLCSCSMAAQGPFLCYTCSVTLGRAPGTCASGLVSPAGSKANPTSVSQAHGPQKASQGTEFQPQQWQALMVPSTGRRTQGHPCVWVSQPFPAPFRRIAEMIKSHNLKVSQLAQ